MLFALVPQTYVSEIEKYISTVLAYKYRIMSQYMWCQPGKQETEVGREAGLDKGRVLFKYERADGHDIHSFQVQEWRELDNKTLQLLNLINILNFIFNAVVVVYTIVLMMNKCQLKQHIGTSPRLLSYSVSSMFYRIFKRLQNLHSFVLYKIKDNI